MNRPVLKRSLITVGLLLVVGTVGADTYYTHELAERLGSGANPPQAVPQTPEAKPADEGSRALGGWDPQAEMHRIQQQIDGLFEDSLQRMQADIGALEPVVSIPSESELSMKEEKGDYVVTAHLPGVKEGGLGVSLDGRLLRVSAQSQSHQEEKADNGRVVGEETDASSTERAFTLPGPVDASRMRTHFEDGVLTVRIPKLAS